MPNNVELVRLSMLRVRDGVVLPSLDGSAGFNWDEKDWLSVVGVDGADEGVLVPESSNGRPLGRAFSIGVSSSS